MSVKWRKEAAGGFTTVYQEGGKTLRSADDAGRGFLERDGYLFKDLNGDGRMVPYKDWRLTAQERAEDLAGRLSIEEIAGLMLYSSHQTVTAKSSRYAKLFGANTYDGKPFDPETMEIWQLTDQQKKFLAQDHVRHLLVSSVDNALAAARWANEVQRFCEASGFGIPANISTDPRHGIKADAEYNLGSGSDISHWPEGIGLAATFDPELVHSFAKTAAAEYRALGITTALSPQIDLGTEPRWRRLSGTFGIHPKMAADMARAYCDGIQTTEDSADGWGLRSVNAMVKHWPGGGTGEGGRDAHYCYGKYAVYPGGHFAEHLLPFTEGAFRLKGKTKQASAVMPYYTISYDQDLPWELSCKSRDG